MSTTFFEKVFQGLFWFAAGVCGTCALLDGGVDGGHNVY
jgi:hypothetical protein